MTEVEAQEIVTLLTAAFPGTLSRLSDEQQLDTFRVYRMCLVDLPFEVTKLACTHLVGTARFFPTVAEIRKAVLEIAIGKQRTGLDAWGDVMRAVSRYGRYRTPEFDDHNVDRCVKAIGWVEICDSEFIASERARFIEGYEKQSTDDRDLMLESAELGVLEGQADREATQVITDVAKMLTRGKP